MKFQRKGRRIKQYLKYYYTEVDKYRHFWDTTLSKEEAIIILKLLISKFKYKPRKINFNYKNPKYGGWTTLMGDIYLKRNRLNLLIICHEYCHLKYLNHSRDFQKLLERVVSYVERKLQWQII